MEAMEVGTISKKRISQMATIDAMPRELRECVHEFGLPIVTVLVKFGVTDPRHIREVVREVWRGPRQELQNTGAMGTIDVLLSHGVLSSKALVRLLQDSNLAIVSMEPSREMLDASMNEVSDFTIRCTKEEKHRRRLRAAIMAGAKSG